MEERFRRRRLPHWDLPGAIYFVTSCLAGSLPAQGRLEIERYRRSLERRPRPAGMSEADWKAHRWKLIFGRAEDWLDHQPAVRHLKDPRLAAEVVKSIHHFEGARYDLLAWVVMPSHIHWVFRPLEEWIKELGSAIAQRSPRERIMHSLKRYTARECNLLLGRQGAFWQDASYDHCVRDEEELERIIEYVERNPVTAGRADSPEEWPFSSAAARAKSATETGSDVGQVYNLPVDD